MVSSGPIVFFCEWLQFESLQGEMLFLKDWIIKPVSWRNEIKAAMFSFFNWTSFKLYYTVFLLTGHIHTYTHMCMHICIYTLKHIYLGLVDIIQLDYDNKQQPSNANKTIYEKRISNLHCELGNISPYGEKKPLRWYKEKLCLSLNVSRTSHIM